VKVFDLAIGEAVNWGYMRLKGRWLLAEKLSDDPLPPQ
jgi:hypothetical protein